MVVEKGSDFEKQWVIYILECCDGSYYTGITNSLDKRMEAHALGNGSKYVYGKGFRRLIAVRECKDRSDASKAECFVKGLPRGEKVGWFGKI